MAVPLIDLQDQHEALREPLEDAFAEVLTSGQFILGPFVERFEASLAEYCKVEHAIGVSSGTDALLVALMALGIGPGDEVITTPFTFFATAGSISRVGAKPVFADIIPRTYNIDIDRLEGALTRNTKAIMPVHMFGLPANMRAICAFAEKHGLEVIEDAAQALGARYDGQPVGGIGRVGCFSFYPTKSLPALGDAGAVVTNDSDLAEKIRILRVHGSDRGYHFPLVGGNFRIDAIQAAALHIKLSFLDKWIERRRAIADRYGRKFEELPLTTPFEPDERFHAYNQYTVRIRGGQREAVRHHLDACGIGTRVYYPEPLHLQPCYESLHYKVGSMPAAEKACEEVLSLPIYPEMTNAQQDEVVSAVRDFFKAE